MFSELSLQSTIPPKVSAYLIGFSPDHDARQWMKGDTPIWAPNVPLEVFAYTYLLPKSSRDSMVARLIGDSYKRFGYEDDPTKYNDLPCTQPDFDFEWLDANGKPTQQWILGVQETTLCHMLWCLTQGHIEAFHLSAIQFLTYYNNKKWRYLRDGGDPKELYGTNGRHRTVRGCIEYCAVMLLELAIVNVTSGKEVELLEGLLGFHVKNLYVGFPLIDDGAGDHLGPGVQFVSNYQTSALREACDLALIATKNTTTVAALTGIIKAIDDLLIDFGPVGPSSPAWWFYDTRFVDGKPVAGNLADPKQTINKGVSGVGYWHAPMLAATKRPEGSALLSALKADAIALKWPTDHPESFAFAFGAMS